MRFLSLVAVSFLGLLIAATPARAVFIGDGSGNLWDHDVTTNTSTLIGSGIQYFDIAQDPTSGILYGVTGGGSLYSIDTTDASFTFIGATGGSMNGLTFGADGTLYGSGSSLYTIDLITGAATNVGAIGFASSGDLAFDTSGNLYMSATGGDRLILVDENTGAGSLIGNIGFGNVWGLNYSNSTLYGFTSGGQTISIDTTTGTGTFIANNSINAFGADGAGGVSVPEPSVIALFGMALVGLGFVRRRKAS